MYLYELLEPNCYYLIQEKEEGPLSLIKVHFKSEQAVCLSTYSEGEEIVWKKKSDSMHDIIECMDDKIISQWEKTYFGQDAFYEDEEE